MDSAAAGSLELGRDAVKRHAWMEALEAFAAADREGGLAADDLELMGEAAWWAGKPEEASETHERAFTAYVEAGRPIEAAGAAFLLAYMFFRRQAPSVGAGWFGRAAGLLEGTPESGMHAWLHLFAGMTAVFDHRMVDGLAHADRAIAVAREHGNADVQFMATSFKGYGEMHQGNIPEGLAFLDEAAAAATSGQLGLRVASDILCNTIAACRNIGDLKRAGQWADEGERWMRRQAVGGYPGICRVHRAELKMLRGQWPEAELEARQACEELQRFGLNDGLGYAHHEIGEIRLRMGDLQGAADAFERAYELGDDGQPGIALLHLARGELDDAWRSIERALAATQDAEGPVDQATRGRLLPAAIDIALARGEIETARAAVEELESIAAGYKRPLFEAGALTAKGELLLGEDRPSEASPILGRSWRLWTGQRPALRERASPASLRRGDRRRGRQGDGPEGPPGRSDRVRAPGRDARPAAGGRAARGGAGARGLGGASHQDVHVHRHRHLDGPGRAGGRRGLGRAPGMAQPGASIGLRKPPRRGSQEHRRRLLRGVREGCRCDRVRGRHPATAGATSPRARVRARRCGSACTQPKRRRMAVTTAAEACTSPPASGARHRARRSWSRPTSLEAGRTIPVQGLGAARLDPQGSPRAGRGSRRRLALA